MTTVQERKLGVTPGGRHQWVKTWHGIVRKPIGNGNLAFRRSAPLMMGSENGTVLSSGQRAPKKSIFKNIFS